MKKNRFKSWIIKVLHKWLAKLEPGYNTIKVEHTYVPLVTVDAKVATIKSRPLSEERLNEILARKLGEEVIKYAEIMCCEKVDMSVFNEQIIYRATVRVAADKRG